MADLCTEISGLQKTELGSLYKSFTSSTTGLTVASIFAVSFISAFIFLMLIVEEMVMVGLTKSTVTGERPGAPKNLTIRNKKQAYTHDLVNNHTETLQ